MRPRLLTCSLALAALGCSSGEIRVSSSEGAGGGTASTGATSNVASSSSGVTGSGGAAGACAPASPGPGDHTGTVTSSGVLRTYLVHVPPSYDPAKQTELVLCFPGFLEASADIENISEMDATSDAHGFLTVYPQGLDDSFNAGACCGLSGTDGVDDVQFTRDLLDQLAQDFCVDPRRVFSSGFSNGGMFSHRLACELSDRIAAIGSVSGTLAISDCAPPRPVPVLHIHGTADPVVEYENGGLSGGEGVPQTIATWVAIDGCTDATPATVYQNGDATCTEYEACKAGTDVELCVIAGGGHQWPGGMSDFLGLLSDDLDASETIAQFFEAHPMP
jgi:polyhydroxybutyrate depolymerase